MPILKSAPEGTESALQGYPYPPAVQLGKRNFSQVEIFTLFVHQRTDVQLARRLLGGENTRLVSRAHRGPAAAIAAAAAGGQAWRQTVAGQAAQPRPEGD